MCESFPLTWLFRIRAFVIGTSNRERCRDSVRGAGLAARVIETVVVVIPIVVMHLYHVLCGETQSAECATTALSFGRRVTCGVVGVDVFEVSV